MAEGTKIREKLEEAGTCSICKDYYLHPVTLDCGHNFCSTCFERATQLSGRRPDCPFCKEVVQIQTLRPNRQLSNMLDVVQDMSNLLMYRGVCSVEEAEKKLAKDQISRGLEILKKGREDILGYTAETQTTSQDMLDLINENRKDAEDGFRDLHRFLHEEEEKFRIQMDTLKNDHVRERDEHLASLSEELSSLVSLTQETEKKLLSDSEIQKISGDILQSCKKKKSSKEPFQFSADLNWRFHDCRDIAVSLECLMKKFQETLTSGLELKEENVELRPMSANSLLTLSEDRKSVRFDGKHLDLQKDEVICKKMCTVFGQKPIRQGRHFWDIAVSNGEDWSVGVYTCIEKIKKKVRRVMRLVEMRKRDGEYSVFNFTNEEPESVVKLRQELKKIRVIVNIGGREVGFYDADTGENLAFEFINVPLEGLERLLPYFRMLRKGHLTLCPSKCQSQQRTLW